MKRILRYNESTSSVEHLLPGDGSYKRIGHSDYEKIEYAFSYVSTPESKTIITDLLQSLYNKLKTIEGCYTRLRHNSVTYETNLFSDVFVDIKLRAEDWYIINIQLRDDVVILIADGEFGVQKFIEDFDPNNPYMKTNKLNESISFPEDEGYIEIDHEEFSQFVDQYAINNSILSIEDIQKQMYSKLRSLDLYPLSNDKDNLTFDYRKNRFNITISTRDDDWVLMIIGCNPDIHFYICDGQSGVTKFINEFDPSKYPGYVNESIEFPDDSGYMKISYEMFQEFTAKYHMDYNSVNRVQICKIIFDRLNSLDLSPEANQAKDYLKCESDLPGLMTQFRINPREDNWVIILFKNSMDNKWTYYLCDSEEGVHKYINDFNPKSSQKRLNESIIYPNDESFIEIDVPTLREVRNIFKKASYREHSDTLEELLKSKITEMGIKTYGNSSSAVEFDNKGHFSVQFEYLNDEWIIIHVFHRNTHKFYLCDTRAGAEEFINQFNPDDYYVPYNEAINYPDDGSFSKLDYDTSYSDFLHQYDQEIDRNEKNKYVDLLHNYFFKKNLPVAKYRDTIQIETPEYVNSVDVSPYSDGWILVNSYQGAFLCDQLEGFQAFLDSDILLSDPEANLVNESVEDDIDEDSYTEASSDDYIYMWKRYKPADFEEYEIQELKDALDAKISINVFPGKEFTLSLYSRSERVLFTVNKMNDGWILVKTDDDNYYVCDQVAGLINFMDV